MMRQTRRDRAQIANFWNAIVRRERPDPDGLDRDIAHTITALHTGDDAPPPNAEFARRLEERLMTQWSARFEGQSVNPRVADSDGAMGHGWLPETRAARLGVRRLAGAVATATLLLFTVLGISLTLDRASDGPEPTSTGIAAGTGSPTPLTDDPRWICTRSSPFIPCGNSMVSVGQTSITIDQGQPTDWEVRGVQLQEWRLEPGAEFPTGTLEDVPGLVVDVVLGGAYSATFDIPITVYRQFVPTGMGGPMPDHFPAGSPVELVIGDAVAFPIGAQQSVRNPLTHMPLRFKRVVLADDLNALFPFNSDTEGAQATEVGGIKRTTAGERWTMEIDGENTLAEPLSAISSYSLAFSLNYVRIPDGATFPPDWCCIVTAIGPVAPEHWEGEGLLTEGYVLFVSEPRG